MDLLHGHLEQQRRAAWRPQWRLPMDARRSKSPATVPWLLGCLVLGAALSPAMGQGTGGKEPAGRNPDTAPVRSDVPDSARKAQKEQARAMHLMDLARQVDPDRIDGLASLTPEEKAYVKKMAGVLQPPEQALEGEKEKKEKEKKAAKEAQAAQEAKARKESKVQKDEKSPKSAEGEVEP